MAGEEDVTNVIALEESECGTEPQTLNELGGGEGMRRKVLSGLEVLRRLKKCWP